MQSISLVPSTAYNNSIYIAEKKNCDRGVIVLEDRITEYYMDVQSTTAVSVDMRLLHQLPNSALKFTLIVYSTGDNVLNLSGFNVEQIQVLNGKSVFTVMKGVGDAYWNIQMTSTDVRPEMWLRCYTLPYAPNFNTGIYNFFNLYSREDRQEGMFSSCAPGQVATGNYGVFGTSNISPNGYICTKFPMPVWLKSICISVTDHDAFLINNFPISLQVYGTNDGIGWTQILNTELTPNWGSVDTYTCTTTNYYTMFKYNFIFSNEATFYYFPSVALSGFSSELIDTGSYSLATPYTTILPLNGYDIEANDSDMQTTENSITVVTRFYENTYHYMKRNTNVPWEFIFTFPEAIRTIGFAYSCSLSMCFKLFSLSYSDDKETWTEYCKVDGTTVWSQKLRDGQIGTYFIDSISEHRYYKITIYTLYSDYPNECFFKGLGFLQFNKGHYFSFESFVPKLSSNTQSGYMLIASSSSEGDAYKLFDQSITSYGGGQISNGDWSLVIKLPQATVVRGLEMVSPTSSYHRMPYAFSLQGSQDNDTWTNIKTFLLGSNYWSSALQIGQWDVENETAYSYYRLVVTNTVDGYVRIGELGLSSYASFKGVNWYEEEYLVPVMDSNEQDGYVVSSKSQYSDGYAPWKAFDRSSSDEWVTSETDKTDDNKECDTWIQIQLPEAKAANYLYILGRSGFTERSPADFMLKASNDGETWATLLTQTDQVYTEKEWTFENSTSYTYYRLEITKTNSDNSDISISIMNLVYKAYHESN